MTDGERDPAAATWPLGERVRQARGRLSLKHVSDKAGIGVETIRQVENKRRADGKPWSPPRPGTVQKLARALDIPEREALELAGYKPSDYIDTATDEGPPLMSPAVLAEQVAKMDPEMRRALETIVVTHLKAKGYIAADAPEVPVRSVGEGEHGGVRSRGEVARGVETSEDARD